MDNIINLSLKNQIIYLPSLYKSFVSTKFWRGWDIVHLQNSNFLVKTKYLCNNTVCAVNRTRYFVQIKASLAKNSTGVSCAANTLYNQKTLGLRVDWDVKIPLLKRFVYRVCTQDNTTIYLFWLNRYLFTLFFFLLEIV